MRIAILTNDSDIAKYFVVKVSEYIKIDEVIIENNHMKSSPRKNFVKRFLGTKKYIFLKFVKYIFIGKSRIEKLEFKLEKEAKKKYLCDFNKVISHYVDQSERLDFNAKKDLDKLRKKNIDLFILFGTSIVKDSLLEIPSKATINFHSSLLPYYKGTVVEFWQLFNKDYKYCGATIHFVDKGIDTGNILVQEGVEVSDKDTFFDLRYKNIKKGIELIPKAIELLEEDFHGYKQETIDQEVFKFNMLTDEKKIIFYKRLGIY